MSQKSIPEQIKRWADDVIKQFNEDVIRDPNRYYVSRYKGRYLYLDRFQYGAPYRVGRLTYTGNTDSWEFAIYKYSNERYDAEEWMFPALSTWMAHYPEPCKRAWKRIHNLIEQRHE